MPAIWVLIGYCAVSLVLVYSLCAGGCLRGFDVSREVLKSSWHLEENTLT